MLLGPKPKIIDMGDKSIISVSEDNTFLSATGNQNRTINFDSRTGALYVDGNGTHNINILPNAEHLQGKVMGKNNVTINSNSCHLVFGQDSVNNVTVTSEDAYLQFYSGSKNTVTLTENSSNSSIHFFDNNNTITTAGTMNSIHFISEDITSFISTVYSKGNDTIWNSNSILVDFTGDNKTNNKEIRIDTDKAVTEIKAVDEANKTTVRYNYDKNTDIVFTHYYNANASASVDGEDYIALKALDKNGNLTSGETKIWGAWHNGDFNLESMNSDKLAIGKGYGGEYVSLSGLTQYIDMGKHYENTESRVFDYDAGDLLNCAKDYYFAGTTNNETYDYIKFDRYPDPNPPYDYIQKDIVINDAGGENDVLSFDMDCNWINFFFDVNVLERDSEGKVTSYQIGNDLIFTNSLSTFLKGTGNSNTITIKNAFDAETGKIENIIAESDDFKLNYDGLLSKSQVDGHDSVVQELVSWLSNEGSAYSSISDALSTTGTTRETIATDLTYIYDGHNGSYTYSSFWTLA